jgi:hypothetical protein
MGPFCSVVFHHQHIIIAEKANKCIENRKVLEAEAGDGASGWPSPASEMAFNGEWMGYFISIRMMLLALPTART